MTYSPKHRATVVRPNNLDPRNNADCTCETIVTHRIHGAFCPRHEPIGYGMHNSEHRGGRHVANSHNESAPITTSMANCEPARCYENGGSARSCPRHDPEIYADLYARHSTDSFFY